MRLQIEVELFDIHSKSVVLTCHQFGYGGFILTAPMDAAFDALARAGTARQDWANRPGKVGPLDAALLDAVALAITEFTTPTKDAVAMAIPE